MLAIKVVSSTALERWDVKHALAPQWMWPASQLVPFGQIAKRRRAPDGDAGTPYGSVHFDGSVSKRPEGTQIKGKTFIARPGDLVFSRIDVTNGAIAVIPAEVGEVAFTNEYPIYDLAGSAMLPEFASLLCRSRVFRATVRAVVVGHTGRKRVPAEVFESIRIPLLPISEQEDILESHRAGLEAAERMRQRAAEFVGDAVVRITKALGLKSIDTNPIPGAFLVPFHLLDRWSVYAGGSALRGITDEVVSNFPIRHLGDPDLSSVAYGISKSPRNRPGRNARPYLRVANVQDGYLDLSEIKYIDVPESQMSLFRLEPLDLLLCEANGTLDRVGSPAIWKGEIEDCVHQNHVLRVRCQSDVLWSDYLLAYMQTTPSRGYFRRRAKSTTGLHTINSTDIRQLPIPLPPMSEQLRIAHVWTRGAAAARAQLKQAREQEQQTKQVTEARIAGTAPTAASPG